MDAPDRRRNLRIAAQELDNAIGLLRTAIDKLRVAADRISAVRDEDSPTHERSP